MRRRTVLLSIGAAAAGTVAAAWPAGKPAVPTPTDPPTALPPAVLIDADGRAHGLEAFAGSGLVVNLWATWCLPCVAELPALAKLAGRVRAAGIVVLPLSSDRGGAPVVEEFYRRHGIEGLPVWLDPKGAAARAWGVQGLPTTIIVDRQGRERGRVEGMADWASNASVAAIRRLVG